MNYNKDLDNFIFLGLAFILSLGCQLVIIKFTF